MAGIQTLFSSTPHTLPELMTANRFATIHRALIPDEPSAGLDVESEKLVFDALENLMKGKTSIVIAHSLATVRRADIIFVVDGGIVVEQGTHDELLTHGGLYSRLYGL